MLIAALVIGLLTAYYFGLKPGGYAALGAAALFAIAAISPGLAVPIYLVVSVALIGILFFGPRTQRPGHRADLLRWLRRALKQLRRLL